MRGGRFKCDKYRLHNRLRAYEGDNFPLYSSYVDRAAVPAGQ